MSALEEYTDYRDAALCSHGHGTMGGFTRVADAAIAELEAEVRRAKFQSYNELRQRAEKAEAENRRLRESLTMAQNARRTFEEALAEAQARADALYHKRLPCAEAEVAQKRYEQAERALDIAVGRMCPECYQTYLDLLARHDAGGEG